MEYIDCECLHHNSAIYKCNGTSYSHSSSGQRDIAVSGIHVVVVCLIQKSQLQLTLLDNTIGILRQEMTK